MKKIIGSLILFLFLNNTCYASNWITQHMDSITNTSGMTFEDQKRGVFTGPALSIRSNSLGKIRPLSMSPPSINVGCGGIDVFLGSFGYLQPEYLIEKFKKMLGAAAPAVAYSLAMSVVSDEIKNTYENITAIIDRLNQLNLDSCSAVKQVQAVIEDKKPLGQAATDFLSATGWAETRQAIEKTGREWKNATNLNKKIGSNSDGSPKSAKACPKMIKIIEGSNNSVFFRDVGFIVFFDSLTKIERDFIVGIVGDFYIPSYGNVSYIKPCNTISDITLDKLMNNQLKIADGYEKKGDIMILKSKKAEDIDGYDTFLDYVKSKIQKLGECVALNDYSSLDSDDKTFLTKLPFGLTQLFRYELSGLSYSEKQLKIASITSIYGNYLTSLYLNYIFNEYVKLTNDLITELAVAIQLNTSDPEETCIHQNSDLILESMKLNIIPKIKTITQLLADEMPAMQQTLVNTLAIEERLQMKKQRFERRVKLQMLEPKK